MKGLTILTMIILALKAIKMEIKAETPQDKQLENLIITSYPDDYEEDARPLRQIQLFDNDDRCNEHGVCTGLNYGDEDEVVIFSSKLKIRLTSKTTYNVIEPSNFRSLIFDKSKFANFPLNLFDVFKIKELDFRNCSLLNLKRDNFLRAGNLSVLLLSENRLSEIKPMLFTYMESLEFLVLDSNRLKILYNDSFKGLDQLNFLDLHNNFIESLPSQILSYMPKLQYINLSDNRLKIIEYSLFAGNPRLLIIDLQRNHLKQLDEYAFKHQELLKLLDISHNSNLEILVSVNLKVDYLWAKNCSLKRINIYGQSVNVDLSNNFIKELYFSEPQYLVTMRLKDNNLEQISSLTRAINLTDLDVSHNPQLKTLPDLYQFNSLEKLDLSNISLRKMPLNILTGSPKLKTLNISVNLLEKIMPSSFKYLHKLSQFYIHHNNWRCSNLQLLMDKVIKPLKISYTRDKYGDKFPAKYIRGIKCMHAKEQMDNDNLLDSCNSRQLDESAQQLFNTTASHSQQLKDLENIHDVKELTRAFKSIFDIYGQKITWVFNKLDQMDLRLKKFERFNETMWSKVSIVL